ncbi:MarP family serine protease [Galbitalea sp. SE-J8]|uniref:MarP family serine protease n=1 Tax=Galbitalea sp. SE-J8 TaxID=3054952 RepID=UPI00259CCFA9|nr:MarP family serine protease [Galbitalea sp. SE-J8]MDM4762597.1 MarP family serine protease [Galbitalea sp. SE-J8]
MGIVLDVILLVALVGYVVSGARKGFAHGIGSIAGVIAGGVAGYFLVPFLGSLIPDAFWRLLGTIAVFVGLVAVGHAIGAAAGDAIGRRMRDTPLRVVDRVLGALAGGVVAALVMSFLAASVAPLGVPVLSTAVGQSTVLRAITTYTPEPVSAFLARVRSGVVRDTIPSIVGTLGGVEAGPAPDADTGTAALRTAAASVVRVTGTASACAQTQAGTGFVVAPGRVITNAHVVAGVPDPVVQVGDGSAFAASVVSFDPEGDLAVLAVPHLDVDPLPLAPKLDVGDDAVYDGYPYGGPFVTGPARVIAVGEERVDDIYGDETVARDVYTLAADIEQGDSGGPLLTTDGRVAGVVFAKSASSSGIGYAMTVDELAPVVADAAGYQRAVDPGRCQRG